MEVKPEYWLLSGKTDSGEFILQQCNENEIGGMSFNMEGKSKWGAEFRPWSTESVDVAVRNAQGSSSSAISAASNETIRRNGSALSNSFHLHSIMWIAMWVCLQKWRTMGLMLTNNYNLKAFLAIQGINYEKLCSCINFLEAVVDFESSWECLASALLTKDLIPKANAQFTSEPHVLHGNQNTRFPNSSAFFWARDRPWSFKNYKEKTIILWKSSTKLMFKWCKWVGSTLILPRTWMLMKDDKVFLIGQGTTAAENSSVCSGRWWEIHFFCEVLREAPSAPNAGYVSGSFGVMKRHWAVKLLLDMVLQVLFALQAKARTCAYKIKHWKCETKKNCDSRKLTFAIWSLSILSQWSFFPSRALCMAMHGHPNPFESLPSNSFLHPIQTPSPTTSCLKP